MLKSLIAFGVRAAVVPLDSVYIVYMVKCFTRFWRHLGSSHLYVFIDLELVIRGRNAIDSRWHNDLYSTVLSHIKHYSLLFVYFLAIRVLINDFGMVITDLHATTFERAYLVVAFSCASFRAHVDLATLGFVRILLTRSFPTYIGEPLVAFQYFTVVTAQY